MVIAQDGLAPSGFLLMAVGHLVRAREALAKKPDSRGHPYLLVDDACDCARRALKMLKEKK